MPSQVFMQCIETIGDTSALHISLKGSNAPEEHVARLLSRFSPSTLEKYLACVATFLDFRQSDIELTQGELTVQGLADYLMSTQRSAVQHRASHRVSPMTALKALRWFAKLAEWQELRGVHRIRRCSIVRAQRHLQVGDCRRL